MENQTVKTPAPWLMLILTFVLATILLVSLCLAILDPTQMELISAAPDLLQDSSLLCTL